ncbi:MAG: peptidase S41 [Flavobacteriaceae bacterium]|nr:peptidase S41 [Flavobacteriaceae bacterium]
MKKSLTTLALTFLILLTSCNKDETILVEPSINDKVNYFIWRGLGTYYFWQEDVPDLSDERFTNFDELYNYFRNYSSPEEVFYSLLYQYEVVDRFSWIVDDYIALENSFQGINVANGMEFGLVRNKTNNTNVFGYVRYVVPNSDAEIKGITRGMIFNKVDGQSLNEDNFSNLLFGSNLNYTIELADYNNGDPVANGTTIGLTKAQINENPVKIAKVFNEGNTKIGYLLYNQFAANYDSELNAAIGYLRSQNIDELIVDLRYNPGGFTSSAIYLGSMITGQFTGQLYSKEVWNSKVMNALSPDLFENDFVEQILFRDSNGNVVTNEPINSMNLNRVYFITSGSTASASELVINALGSYIDVRVIGSTTTGKQVGSVTLYDTSNLFRSGNNLSSQHTYALQPIVFEITNKDGENYPNGIIPGTSFNGINLPEDYGNLGVLGEKSDPLLNRTINYILTGQKFDNSNKEKGFTLEEIYNSKLATPSSDKLIKTTPKFNFTPLK